MEPKKTRGLSLLIAALLLAALPGVARAASVSDGYTRTTGNADVGARLDAGGRMVQNETLVQTSADLAGHARLFGGIYEAIRMEGDSRVENGQSSNRVTARVAGYTVYSISRSYDWTWDWRHSQTYFTRSKTLFLAGVPVSCDIQVGGTLFAELELGLGPSAAGLRGKFGSNTWGSATAGVDSSLYRVRKQSDITLFDDRLEPALTARPAGIDGSLDYVSNAVTVYLELFLDRARWKRSGWTFKRTWEEIASTVLADWRGAGMRRPILSY